MNIRDKTDPISQPALSLLYLAGYVRQHLECPVEIKIIESHDPLAAISEFRPDVLGFTSFSVMYRRIVECAKDVKQRLKPTIVIGGHHISGVPESLDTVFDLAVLYEGEETFTEVLAKIHAQTLDKDKATIRGIAYHGTNGQVVCTTRRDAIADLDKLPLPAFDLLDDTAHMQFNYGTGWKKTLPLITTRGCPHKCTFCSSSAFWRKVRWLSAERVIASIEELIGKYKITRIQLVDDMFIWPPERFRKVHKYLLETGLNKKISFRGAARCDLMNDEVVKMLKDIQFETVGFGIEFGSQRNLDYTHKHATVEENRRGLVVCKKGGMDTGSGFIVGVPGETEDDLRQTYEFIRDMPIDIPELYILIPYPGTPLHVQLWAEGTEYQRKRLSDYEDLNQGIVYSGWQLFLVPWRVNVPEIWTNPALSTEVYRSWILRILRLSYRRKVSYLLRLVRRNWSVRYVVTLIRYVFGSQREVSPEPEVCEG